MPRLVLLSDTHTLHARYTPFIVEAQADILVHCGDFCRYHGTLDEVGGFAEWCRMLLRKGYVKHIVAVAGNHDEVLDATCPATKRGSSSNPSLARERLEAAGVCYLQDRGATVGGLRFYGTPWVEYVGEYGFQWDNRGREEEIFQRIPEGLDVLVTHTPPHGILDAMVRINEDGTTWMENTGSTALLSALRRTRPRVNAFGHIHPRHGLHLTPFGTLCVNAASLDGENRALRPTHRPIVLDLG